MSQCHDVYAEIPTHAGVARTPEGAQCHDPAEERSGLGSTHRCRLIHAEDEGVQTVYVTGRLDWATAGELRTFVRDRCGEDPVIIDLTSASFDSAGTGALLSLAAAAEGDGRSFAVVAPDPLAYRVLNTCGLGLVATLTHDEHQARLQLHAAV